MHADFLSVFRISVAQLVAEWLLDFSWTGGVVQAIDVAKFRTGQGLGKGQKNGKKEGHCQKGGVKKSVVYFDKILLIFYFKFSSIHTFIMRCSNNLGSNECAVTPASQTEQRRFQYALELSRGSGLHHRTIEEMSSSLLAPTLQNISSWNLFQSICTYVQRDFFLMLLCPRFLGRHDESVCSRLWSLAGAFRLNRFRQRCLESRIHHSRCSVCIT